MIRFTCPQCQMVLQAPPDQAGATVTCPRCKSRMRVPAPLERTEWHYIRNEQPVGPVSWAQLRQLASSGQLQPTEMVWKAGMPAWAAASSINDLFPPPRAASSPPPEEA